MRVLELVGRARGVSFVAGPDAEIAGIAFDSRLVRRGDLFIAVHGEQHDATRFVPQAIANGAVAVAAEGGCPADAGAAVLDVEDARKFMAEASWLLFGDPGDRLTLAGATGTNGKTTTVQLIDAVFRASGRKSFVVGTLGYQGPGGARTTGHTTPEAPELAALLAESIAGGCTHGAIEISSHSLALRRVFGLKIAVGVFMNLTQEHQDFHQDMESYFQAKMLLFEAAGGNRIGAAVVNVDDPYGRRLAASVSASCTRFGLEAATDVRVTQETDLGSRRRLCIETPSGAVRFETRLLGRPNLYNLMAAAASTAVLGIPVESIAAGLESVHGVPGRLEFVDAGQPFRAVVDYAHTPDALERLLDTARTLASGKLIAVFGCGGDRDRKKRPVMGRIAAERADVVIATSDNPRSEDPVAILDEVEAGLREGPAGYRIEPDRRKAIRAAVRAAAPGDIVVVAGKGHEDYQVVGKTTLQFDDRLVTKELIEESMREARAGSGGSLERQQKTNP